MEKNLPNEYRHVLRIGIEVDPPAVVGRGMVMLKDNAKAVQNSATSIWSSSGENVDANTNVL